MRWGERHAPPERERHLAEREQLARARLRDADALLIDVVHRERRDADLRAPVHIKNYKFKIRHAIGAW